MIRCPNCGTHMEEGSQKCPLCGEPIKQNENQSSSNRFGFTSSDDMFKSPNLSERGTSKTFFSTPSNQINSTGTFFNSQSTSQAPDNNKLPKQKQKYLLAIIGVVILAIVIGCFVFIEPKSKNNSTDQPTEEIELSDVPELPAVSNDPINPSNPDDEEPPTSSGNETPTEPVDTGMKFGEYSLDIPEDYSAELSNDNTLTLVNAGMGYIITIEAGPYNIGAYRANDKAMTESYEKQNAKVERIYDDNIASHDVHILEVDQNGTKFIVAITPSISKKAYILTIFNGYDKEVYDYGALTAALYLCDQIKQNK